MFLKRVVPLGLALLPLFVYAQDDFANILTNVKAFLNLLVTFLMILAVVVFIWGIIKYLGAGSEDELNEARNMILWGVVFLAVMVAVWGFVNIVLDFIFADEPIPRTPIGPQQP